MACELDHVLIKVSDLKAPYPLPSRAGGRHPGWGTANRIVPLGQTYFFIEWAPGTTLPGYDAA